jgi:hypothetical protein
MSKISLLFIRQVKLNKLKHFQPVLSVKSASEIGFLEIFFLILLPN